MLVSRWASSYLTWCKGENINLCSPVDIIATLFLNYLNHASAKDNNTFTHDQMTTNTQHLNTRTYHIHVHLIQPIVFQVEEKPAFLTLLLLLVRLQQSQGHLKPLIKPLALAVLTKDKVPPINTSSQTRQDPSHNSDQGPRQRSTVSRATH